MEETKPTDIEELRTTAHALQRVYELLTLIDCCCSVEWIREMHVIQRELNEMMVDQAVLFVFKSKIPVAKGVVREIYISDETIIIDFDHGISTSAPLNDVEDIIFGKVIEVKVQRDPVWSVVRKGRKDLMSLGIIDRHGIEQKEINEYSPKELELLKTWKESVRGIGIKRVAIFE